METVTLSNGKQMPAIGFGTWKAPSDEITVNAVKTAVECGYTHIDAAAAYHNEVWVGKGIRESGIKREDLFLTSKLWNDDHGYESTLAAFENTVTDLGVDYLDLYLIHWPVPVKFHDNYIEKNRETWKAFEELYKAGKVGAIGVSNFKPHHIDEILEVCEIPPMVNQIEFHPSCLQEEIRTYCKEHNIVVEAYSPLAHGKVFQCQEIREVAERNGVSVAQLCVKYAMQHKTVPLVKSVTRERIQDNLHLDFTISDEDMRAIDAITNCEGAYKDSDHINF